MNFRRRAGVIIFHKDALLLMYRKKNGKAYYVFPGGGINPHENNEQAAMRELFEEVSIACNNPRLLFHLHITDIPVDNTVRYNDEFLFLCDYVSGDPILKKDSEKYAKSSDTNYFKPVWMAIDQIKDIVLYPFELRDLLLQELQNGFKNKPIKIERSHAQLREL